MLSVRALISHDSYGNYIKQERYPPFIGKETQAQRWAVT